jgi:hypothetical protein
VGLTVLLVFKHPTAEVWRNLPANFELSPTLDKLGQDGMGVPTTPPASTTPPADRASLPGIRSSAGS